MRSHFLRAAQKVAPVVNPFSLVGSSTVGTATSGATISIDIPDGTAAGDFILVVHAARSGSDLDMSLADSSYTNIADLYANDTYDANLGVHWKISDGTETAISLPGGTGFINSSCSVQVWRGVDLMQPLDVLPVTAIGIDTPKAISPDITTATPGCLAVLAVCTVTGTPSVIVTAPDGFTNETVASPPSGIASAKAAVASKYSPLSGKVSGGQWETSSGGTQFSWAACTLALRPA